MQRTIFLAIAIVVCSLSGKAQLLSPNKTSMDLIHAAIVVDDNDLVIARSNRNGETFGVFALSKQMEVSPWHIWVDEPAQQRTLLFIHPKTVLTDATKVKYRGIFIDDEAPQICRINKEDKNNISGIWNKWVAENIIIRSSIHPIKYTGPTHHQILDDESGCCITENRGRIGPY